MLTTTAVSRKTRAAKSGVAERAPRRCVCANAESGSAASATIGISQDIHIDALARSARWCTAVT